MNIVTFDGTSAELSKCRKIMGKYYEVNRQCFKMPDGKWHRISNEKIVFLHDINRWVLKGDFDYVSAIIDITSEGEIKFSDCTKNGTTGERLIEWGDDKYIYLFKKCFLETLISLGLAAEELATGRIYIKKKKFTAAELKNLNRKLIRSYCKNLDYRADLSLDYASQCYDERASKDDVIGCEYGNYLEDVSWG